MRLCHVALEPEEQAPVLAIGSDQRPLLRNSWRPVPVPDLDERVHLHPVGAIMDHPPGGVGLLSGAQRGHQEALAELLAGLLLADPLHHAHLLLC
eukprot:3369000-Lingulodinium_polyedra.AAC.2